MARSGGNASAKWRYQIGNKDAMFHDARGMRERIRSHVFFEENFLQCPALNVAIAPVLSGNDAADAAEILVLNQANKNFEVLGVNHTNALVSFAGQFDAGAGIKVMTAGADADAMIILPHLDTKQSQWAAAGQFVSQKQPFCGFMLTPAPAALITTAALTSNVVTLTTDIAHGIPTGASCTVVLDKADSDYDANMALLEGTFTVTAASSTTLTYALTHADISSASIAGSVTPAICYKQILYAGFKKTNTHVLATDNDQAYFRFDTSNATGPTYWHFITSRAGVDVDNVLSVTCVPGTLYRLRVEIDANRQPHIWINGQNCTGDLSAAGAAALATGINLIPYHGTVAVGSTPAAKAYTICYQEGGRNAA